MILVHQEKVVEVAAHLLRRCHRGVQIKLRPVRKRRKRIRQHVLLDLGGQRQLRADPFLLGRNFADVIDVAEHILLHFVDLLRERLDLIAGFDGGKAPNGLLGPLSALAEAPHLAGEDAHRFHQPLHQVQNENNDDRNDHDKGDKDNALYQCLRRALDPHHRNLYADHRRQLTILGQHRHQCGHVVAELAV